ncbi:MucR family transcriptional regulator [Roseicyclus sp.]|uniref:MucR family transcriptional regulator n=1 Tax=Roseicyclus sp. TaxID=1914329 RepID=UPI003FA13881
MLVQIVSAYAARPDADVEDIAALAEKLSRVFLAEGDAPPPERDRTAAAPEWSVADQPAVSPDKAVTRDKVYCMCCGKGFKMLKRHIGAEHGLTETQYRAKFKLADDFPLVAPDYSEMKARYAKKAGLGKYSRQADSVD